MGIERTLVLIRERQLPDILDLSLAVVRQRPKALALAAVGGIAPFVILNAWIFSQVAEWGTAIPMFLWMLEAPIATAPLTIVLGGMMFDQRPTVGRTALTWVKAAFPLLMIHGVLRFVPLFWIPPRLAFANEILLLERRRFWKIWGRGGDLSSDRQGELFFLGIFEVTLIYVFTMITYAGTARVFQAVMVEEWTWDYPASSSFSSLRFQIPIWLGAAFFAIARFFTYIDQRVRLEGWEVELRLRAVGETMKEARRW